MSRAAGLKTLDVRFFRDPESLPPACWTNERIALYWNRTGLVSPRFLERWCSAVHADRLLFKPSMDPFTHKSLKFTLPDVLGSTIVETVPHTENREDYFRLTERANIFLAPRMYEGIGMTFIEALARGCAVFAHDGATMNEYVETGSTGYLFKRRRTRLARFVARGRRKLAKYGFSQPRPVFTLSDQQPWHEVAALDLPALGHAARAAHEAGFRRWQEDIPKMADFIRSSVQSK